MKKSSVSLLVLVFIALAAIITNPDSELHKETIKTKLKIYLQKAIKDESKGADNEWEQAGQAMGVFFGAAIIDYVIDNTVSTSNYLVFSTTKISWEGKTRVIGIGAFGNVFLTKELDKALDQGLLENTK